MRRPDVVIDDDLVVRLLAAQHPDLVALPLTAVASGWDHVTYRLGDDLALRLPRRELGAGMIQGEQRLLPALAPQLPVEVPVPVRVGVPTDDYPYHWSVTRWVDGQALDDGVLDAADAARVVEVLQALQAVADPPIGSAPHNPYRGIPLVERRDGLHTRLDLLAAGSAPDDAELDPARLRARFEAAAAVARSTSPRWIHGDLHPRNVVVRDGRLAGVVDWSDVTAADVATDLAFFWFGFDDPAARQFARGAWSADEWERGIGWAIVLGATMATARGEPLMRRIGAACLRRVLAEA